MTPEENSAIAVASYEKAMGPCPSMTPEEYRGLYREVVTNDCYRLEGLRFAPDVIVDIGANIGVFTMRSVELFPSAHIVAVEPHPVNFRNLATRVMSVPNVKLVNAAIGIGEVFHRKDPDNGAHAKYLSHSLDFSSEQTALPEWDEVNIPSLMLDELAPARYIQAKLLIKIDCEGGENAILFHQPSMDVLRRASYWCMEVHEHESIESEETIRRRINEFRRTHNIQWDEPNRTVFATKRH